MPFSRVHSGLLLLCPHEHLVKYRDSVKCVEEGERKKKSISIDRSFFNVKKKSQTSAQILSILSYHIQNKIQNFSGGLLLLLSHFSRVQLCVTPQTAAHQAPPSLGFSRQEHWSGLPFPSPMHESEK